jgi:site-specific DNA-cytosine methylase
MNKEFTWAPMVPLIGGHALGFEKAFGKPPVAIYSYPGIDNDNEYVTYQNETLGRNLEFKTFEPSDLVFEQKINAICCTPPCAALSSLNCGKNPEVTGATGKQNDVMYNCLLTAIKKFDADFISIENAPALATPKGKPVADKLFEIASENGYSMTLFKTSTHFHGIPQRRDRTFALFFKNPKAKILDFEKIEHPTFKDYLMEFKNQIVEDLSAQVNKNLGKDDVYYNYLKYFYNNDAEEVRKEITKHNVSCLTYTKKKGMTEDIKKWADEFGTEKDKKHINHAIMKYSKGQGVWDGSVRFFADKMNAVIGRNLDDTMHPFENRSLTIKEALYMMGFPVDFELSDHRKRNYISQNVPTCTAAFIANQGLKYLNGELEDSHTNYLKQDNWNETLTEHKDLKSQYSLDLG